MESVVEVIAEVHLFTGSVSGKTRGYVSGIRPNHFFPGQESSIAGVIWFEGQNELQLGETAKARIRLLYPDSFPELVIGSMWRLHEGSRHVGNAKVVQIL